MNACFPVPGIGQVCLNDISFRLFGREFALSDPSVLAILILVVAILVFVFKSPVGGGR